MQLIPRNFQQRYSGQQGSTIIQMLILAAVFSVVAMAVARLIFLNRNMINEISSRMNVETLHAQIFAQLLDDQSCYNTFQGLTKLNNRAVPAILDNNPVLASAINVFSVNTQYVTNVTIRSMSLTAYTFDGSTAYPPFDALARLTIVYRVPYGEGQAKDFERFMFIRTKNPAAPGAWPDGVAMANVAVRCVASAPPNSALLSGGLNLNENISKRYSDVKNSDFIIRTNAGVQGRLLLNGNLEARGLFTLSDATLKRNITPIKIDFNKLSKIEAYRYKWKESEIDGIGFKAQQVRKFFPELVSKNEKNKYYELDYFGELPLVLEGVKSMEKENSLLEEEISRLEQRERNREISK